VVTHCRAPFFESRHLDRSRTPETPAGHPALRQAKTERRYTREEIQHASAAKQERYAVIRRDFDAGMSERAIERRHHVGRRTIIKALNSADPPARKKIHREPAALNGLHPHIDAMIDAAPLSPPPDLAAPRRRPRHHRRLPHPPHLRCRPSLRANLMIGRDLILPVNAISATT
jgi:hypothetical protein